MLLVIDAGNTNTVFAVFDGATMRGVWRMVTQADRSADEYAVFLKTMMASDGLPADAVTAAIMGSVVPDANFHLASVCRRFFNICPIIVGAPGFQAGLALKIDRPEELGADRLINAVAGLERYKPPLLLIDFGTATTFDVVDATGAFCGGAIAPGINLSLQALHMAAAKLPRVAVARPSKVIGTATVPAIQAGVFWGYVGLIEGLIARIRDEGGFGDALTVIATGGLASLFKDAIPAIQHIDGDLTLRGLRLLYEKNITGHSGEKEVASRMPNAECRPLIHEIGTK
jgi:type III pantothenate kinase